MYIYTRGVFSYPRPWLLNLHFEPSLKRRDVGSQRRDVGTSRRQFYPPLERRDVGKLSSLERRDVALFKAQITFIFCSYPTSVLPEP